MPRSKSSIKRPTSRASRKGKATKSAGSKGGSTGRYKAGGLLEQIQWLREQLVEERKERAVLLTRLQAWNPNPAPAVEPRSPAVGGPSVPRLSQDDRDAFEYAEKLGKLGLKPNPDGEGVIEIETSELWESAVEYEAQKAMDAGRTH